jgi:hypothetical protein
MQAGKNWKKAEKDGSNSNVGRYTALSDVMRYSIIG